MKRILYSGSGLLLIAAAFLVFNMLAARGLPDVRLDLTEQQLHTISEGTGRILAALDEPLELELFFSDGLSRDLTPLRNHARRVEELLRAYERAAGGKLRLKVTDPEPFSVEEDRAAESGLQGVPLQQGGDTLYFGLAGRNARGEVLAIPFFALEQEAFLEYEISRLIQTLASPARPVIGVLSGLPLQGGFNPLTGQGGAPWMVFEQIRQQFEIRQLQPGIDLIPEDVSVLLLVHPRELAEQSLYAIDQFVLRGGKLLAFVDPFSEADNSGMPGMSNASDDLAVLFEAWGLRLRPGEVLADGSHALAVGRGAGQRPVRHVGWLNLPAAALDQQDVTTAGLESLTLATAGILEPLEGATTRFTPLLQSSEYAMPMEAGRFALLADPQELIRDLEPTGERYAIAARIDGPARSAFPEGIEGRKDGLQSAERINLIVVADSDLLADRMWVQVQDFFGQRIAQPFADNGAFVINALDNLAGSDALISVRSRGRYSRPFEVVENLQRQAEARFREQEEVLNQRLALTEQRLAELQQPATDAEPLLELTPEQQATLQQFMQEKLAIRKELREVRYRLNADIEALGRTLKFVNIALVPLLLTLAVIGLWLLRRRRGMA